MKYDCTKVLDFAHEFRRLCNSSYCDRCVLTGKKCGYFGRTDEEMINIVQKWSDEHAEQTRLEKFMELLKGTEFEDAFDARLYTDGTKFLIGLTDSEWWNEVAK